MEQLITNGNENIPSSPKNEFSFSDEDMNLESDEDKEPLEINLFKKNRKEKAVELLYKNPIKKNKNRLAIGFKNQQM